MKGIITAALGRLKWQRTVLELYDQEWAVYCASADPVLRCPTCGHTGRCRLKENETVRWSGCGHSAFIPEDSLTWPSTRRDMPEIRLTCISPEAAAAVVREAARPGDRSHTVRQEGAQVVIGYHDLRWPIDVADWAHSHGHAHDDDAARVIRHL